MPGSAGGRDAPEGGIVKACAACVGTVDRMKRDGLPDGGALVNGVCGLMAKIARLGIVYVMCRAGCTGDVMKEREDTGTVFASLRRH